MMRRDVISAWNWAMYDISGQIDWLFAAELVNFTIRCIEIENRRRWRGNWKILAQWLSPLYWDGNKQRKRFKEAQGKIWCSWAYHSMQYQKPQTTKEQDRHIGYLFCRRHTRGADKHVDDKLGRGKDVTVWVRSEIGGRLFWIFNSLISWDGILWRSRKRKDRRQVILDTHAGIRLFKYDIGLWYQSTSQTWWASQFNYHQIISNQIISPPNSNQKHVSIIRPVSSVLTYFSEVSLRPAWIHSSFTKVFNSRAPTWAMLVKDIYPIIEGRKVVDP